MLHPYQGPYSYDKQTVTNWQNPPIGVYYCGVVLPTGVLLTYYVGQAVGAGGIRDRLLQHLNEPKWRDVTHFGFVACDTMMEAQQFETQEILRCQPKYNTQGKQF
jgi:hypothetical protein